MVGMSSACSNPMLYGWLNGNFRKEFFEMFACMCPCWRERLNAYGQSFSGRQPRASRMDSGVTINMKTRGSERRSTRNKAKEDKKGILNNHDDYVTFNEGVTVDQEITFVSNGGLTKDTNV